ncbi:hypothetical protein ANCDUO_22140, partial [Ancylostoma duodenale]
MFRLEHIICTCQIFVVGDTLGGLLLYEAMTKYEVPTRHGSLIPKAPLEGIDEVKSTGRFSKSMPLKILVKLSNHSSQSAHSDTPNHKSPKSARSHSMYCPSFRKKVQSRLLFQPSTAFLLGCPLGLVLMQKKLAGYEIEHLESCQLFNLYYSLDPCGSRLEPVLNQHLSLLQPANIP